MSNGAMGDVGGRARDVVAMRHRVLAVAIASLLGLPGAAAAQATAQETTRGPASAPDSDAQDLDRVEVTGTRIKGGTTPSPVVTIGSERIREEGFVDLGDVIRSVPQNFAGGQGPGIAAGATGGGQGNQNITGGSGLNLRGLGQDASLTLLNGRRMSYGGFSQGVDIAAIPVEAVDRLEIVADGASAIYGSDAVGGVANVILRRDFDGFAVGTRYGKATDGGLTTREHTATAGAAWDTGGVIATWKKSENDPVFASQRSYTAGMFAPSTLYQGGDLRSGVLSAHQAIGDVGEIQLDALRTERDIVTEMAYAANYERSEPATVATFLAPGATFWLPGDWSLSLAATWGKEATDTSNTVVVPASGTSSATLAAYRNRSRVYEVGAEGPVFALPGGDVRLALGVGTRKNEFELRNRRTGAVQVTGDVGSRFAYAEADVPIVGAEQDVAGVRSLAITGAVRREDYDTFGDVTTPKLGVLYSPGSDVTLKASWGRSFKVPTLTQQYLRRDAILFPVAVLGGSGYPPGSTVLYLAGGGLDLEPERAKTWSASVAFHPASIPGLELEATWFDIDYTDRVVQPLVPTQALSNPAFAEFIRYAPSAAELAEILRTFQFINGTGAPYNPSQVVAIAPNLYVNASRQQMRGLDLSGSLRLDLEDGRLTFRGAATWLDGTRRLSSAQPEFDVAGTLFYPARLNGRFGTVWNSGGFTASAFGNYRSGVRNTVDGRDGASFTTFDATVRYDTGARGTWLSDIGIELSVQNLLDRAPPLYATTSRTFAPYDSTNYSAIGRYGALSISKRW